MTNRYKDQMAMINLLLLINDPEHIDAEVENKLLPSLEWLKDKALNGDSFDEAHQSYNKSQWVKLYQAFWLKYTGNIINRMICFGKYCLSALQNGSTIRLQTPIGDCISSEKYDSPDVAALYAFMKSSRHSAFEEFLLQHNCIQENLVTDFAGTAFCGMSNMREAVRWF